MSKRGAWHSTIRRLVVSLIVLSAPHPDSEAFGQSTYANVSGTVEDSSKALLPAVAITAANNATGVVTTVVTNEAGTYNFTGLLPGTYKNSAELPGF